MAGINLNSEQSSENHYVKRTSAKSIYLKFQFHKNQNCLQKKRLKSDKTVISLWFGSIF